MRRLGAPLALATLVSLLAAPAASAIVEPGASMGCAIHITGHPGVSLELIGWNFTRSSIVRVDYTINGGDPHSITATTDDAGAFDLTILTGPTSMGVYDFVLTDPRCTLKPAAIARPRSIPRQPPPPAFATPPATDAASLATAPAGGGLPQVTIALVIAASVSVFATVRRRRPASASASIGAAPRVKSRDR